MPEPFIGEIKMFGGNFAPVGWHFCDGSLLSIADNTALFQLLGTTYGGDGVNKFGLPDLRGRVPIHQGNSMVLGQVMGEENHTLISREIPSHVHTVNASTAASATKPANAVYASGVTMYVAAPTVQMSSAAIAPNQGGQPHSNMMPYLAISFIIALEGIFPSQS